MENKPIKRSRHLLPLSKDHHFTLLFCWKIRQGVKNGVEPGRIRKYVQHFWQKDMQGHFREEEEILFAAFQGEKITKAVNDHRQIEEQVDKIVNSFPGEASEQLLALADTVEAHVRFEERELFPYLEQQLTEIQWEAIGAQLNDGPASQDDYTDEFWRKENKG